MNEPTGPSTSLTSENAARRTGEYLAAGARDWAFLRAGDAHLPLTDVFVMLQARPLAAIVLLIVLLGAAGALLGWAAEAQRKFTAAHRMHPVTSHREDDSRKRKGEH